MRVCHTPLVRATTLWHGLMVTDSLLHSTHVTYVSHVSDIGLRGSGEGWASPGLRACSAVGSRLAVEGRRSRRRFCEASPHPNEASAFAAAGKIQKPLRRSCAARRSGKRLTRAELLLMVRRARPAPSHRLRCRCRAHRCARPCRILHAGRRWPRDRAERRLQLFDLELPILLHDGAA